MLFENINWNLSDKRKLFAEKQAFIVSIPKSGRTWLRVLLNNYYCAALDSNEKLNSRDQHTDGRPAYFFTHDRYEHQTIASKWHQITGRYLIPPTCRNRHVLVLSRDPRDVMVSLYFQNTKREKESRRFRGNIGEMLDDPLLGVDRVITVMNSWMTEWGDRDSGFLLARYEDWQADPSHHFARVIRFLGGPPLDSEALRIAIEQSQFDRMQAMERSGAEGPRGIKPGDANDPESYKARRGKVGGYSDYLSNAQIARIESAMERLDARFGYSE